MPSAPLYLIAVPSIWRLAGKVIARPQECRIRHEPTLSIRYASGERHHTFVWVVSRPSRDKELYFHVPSCNVAVMGIPLTLGIFLVCLLPAGSESETAKTPGALPVLTTVGAIRQLTPEQAPLAGKDGILTGNARRGRRDRVCAQGNGHAASEPQPAFSACPCRS